MLTLFLSLHSAFAAGETAVGRASGVGIRVPSQSLDLAILDSQSGLSQNGETNKNSSLLTLPAEIAAFALGGAGSSVVTGQIQLGSSVQNAQSDLANLNVLAGLVKADFVRAVVQSRATGSNAVNSTAGSTISGLVVNGTPVPEVLPNTRIDLPEVPFGAGSYVMLYETAQSAASSAMPGVTNSASAAVTMIRVHVTDTDPLTAGNQTFDFVGAHAEAIVTYPGQPFPVISAAPKSVNEGNTGTTDMQFEFTLSNEIYVPATWNYTVVDGSARAGSDYTAVSGTLVFAPHETNKTITIPILGDLLDEPDETLTLRLTGGAPVANPNFDVVGTILDDDPNVLLSVANVSVNENAGSARFVAKLSAPSGWDVSFHYATSDLQARSGADYQASSGDLTIPAGATEATFQVPVINDSVDEPDEAFRVNFSNATHLDLPANPATGTILDDDGPPELTAQSVQVTEPDTGSVHTKVTLRLSAASEKAISVHYATADGFARAGADYVASQGTAQFPAGTTSQEIVLDVLGDMLREGDEQFTVQFSDPVNVTLRSTAATVTIIDNDSDPADLSVTASASPDPVHPTCPLQYVITVRNRGPGAATSVVLREQLPDGVVLSGIETSAGQVQSDGDTLQVSIPELASGATATLKLQVIPSPIDATNLVNIAEVSSLRADPDSSNNRSEISTALDNSLPFKAEGFVLNGQSGLYEQYVWVTNTYCSAVEGIRIDFLGLNSGVRVFNSAGTNADGTGFVQHNFPVNENDSVRFTIEYDSPDRILPRPVMKARAALKMPFPEALGKGVQISRTATRKNGSILVEFPTVEGDDYAIQYSADLVNWQTAIPVVTAAANKIQWIDNGPPKTQTIPGQSGQKFFRVIHQTRQ